MSPPVRYASVFQLPGIAVVAALGVRDVGMGGNCRARRALEIVAAWIAERTSSSKAATSVAAQEPTPAGARGARRPDVSVVLPATRIRAARYVGFGCVRTLARGGAQRAQRNRSKWVLGGAGSVGARGMVLIVADDDETRLTP
jgi:hypothetical protein